MSVPAISLTRLGGRRGATPLVLGPSLGTSAAVLWGPCAGLLADRFDVLGWDLPGHGSSVPAKTSFSMAELAAGVLDALESTLGGPDLPFVYAGDSIGGAVGLQLLLDAPTRVTAATLACTGARIGTADGWRERAELVRAEGTGALLEATPARWFGPGFGEQNADAARSLLADLAAADDESYAEACVALACFDLREQIGAITAPLLAVAGSDDAATPPEGLRAITDAVPGARLVTLDGVGHLAPAEAPEILAALISSHGSGTPSTSGMYDAEADQVFAPSDRFAGLDPVGGREDLIDVHDAGMAVRREVLGAAHVDRASDAATEFTREFQQFITTYAWGSIWTRPGLDRRSRSMITLTALIANGHHEELALHLRGAIANGLTRDEIKEVLLQSAIYCSVPSANTAFRIADRVLSELAAADHDEDAE